MQNTFSLRILVKIWQNAWFNLNGTEPTFQKRNVLHEWICIFSARILFSTAKLRKTHFKKKKCIPSVYFMQNAFFSKKW